MSYLVLARKYRPNNFEEVVGQEHITHLLKSAIKTDRIAHAYLFCGPRGIGKTSCARIFAKSLNCKDGPTEKPCGKCHICNEITQGSSFDVLEIDGASNRGIDEIRALRENVKFSPSYGRYKIYIVDEVHMLTLEAFNALLKTLEEPPPHVKFVFATTDPNKVPSTIISRCQRFDFKRIPLKLSINALNNIIKKEKLRVEEKAVYAIAKASQGSFRDALSILDQVTALKDKEVKGEDIYEMLGLVELEFLFDLSAALLKKDCAAALKIFDQIISQGKDIKQLSKDLIEHYRNMMIIKIGGKALGRLVDSPVDVKERYLSQVQQTTLAVILESIDGFISAQETARITETLRIPLEIAFAKLTYQKHREAEGPPTEQINTQQAGKPKASSLSRVSPVERLKNQRGTINAKTNKEAEEDAEEDTAALSSPVTQEKKICDSDFDEIQKSWPALTHAVSRKKMSVATYLQEGFPVSFKDNLLTVGFPKEHEFYKDTLEHKEYSRLVEDVLSEKMGRTVCIKYKISDKQEPLSANEDAPAVKSALEAFDGKIISQWHNE